MRLEDVHEEVLNLVGQVGAEPDASAESRAFFDAVLAPFGVEERDKALDHIRRMVDSWYVRLRPGPTWVQGCEWPYGASGMPMVFVGEVTVEDRAPVLGGYVFYLFFDPATRETSTVQQTA